MIFIRQPVPGVQFPIIETIWHPIQRYSEFTKTDWLEKMERIPNLKRKDPAKRNLCVGIGALSKNTAGHKIQFLQNRVRLIY